MSKTNSSWNDRRSPGPLRRVEYLEGHLGGHHCVAIHFGGPVQQAGNDVSLPGNECSEYRYVDAVMGPFHTQRRSITLLYPLPETNEEMTALSPSKAVLGRACNSWQERERVPLCFCCRLLFPSLLVFYWSG